MKTHELIALARVTRNDLAGELPDGVGRTIDALLEEITRLQGQRDTARKALFQMRDMLTAVHDGLEDEGDRVYLESTNHADLIREAWHFADSIKWDELLEEEG